MSSPGPDLSAEASPGGGLKGRSPAFVLGALCLAVTTAYVLSMLHYTEGHFVPQVSDFYLTAQYAKGFAEGHPFQYNRGETPTSGATSLLHTVFLACAHFVGFRGEGLVAFAIFSGALFGFLTARAAYRAARRFSTAALCGATLVILNGPLAWSFHYGADIALALFLSTWLFAAWIDAESSDAAASVPATLLVLTRPEALLLVLGLFLARLRESRRALSPLALPVAAGLAVPLALRLITGEAANTSFSRKLLTENWGVFGAAMFSVEYWTDLLRGIGFGFYSSAQRVGFGAGNAPYFAFPLLIVFVWIALQGTTHATKRARSFLAASLLVAVAVTPTIHMGVHSNRYLLFLLPPLLVLGAAGLHAAGEWVGRRSGDGIRAQRSLARIAIAFGTLSVARYGLLYADAASGIYRQDEAVFEFIRRSLPQDTTFLTNGVAIEYQTGRRSINLSGVVTPRFSLILPVETEASAFELLSRPDAGSLPPYLIATEAYVTGSPAWSALTLPTPVFTTTSGASSELGIFATRRDLVGRQAEAIAPPPGAVVADSLNVSDPLDEREHDYVARTSLGTRALFAALKLDRFPASSGGLEMADGGRLIFGSEEFNVKTPRTDKDLHLVIRMNSTPAARVRHPDGETRTEFSMTEAVLRVKTAKGTGPWLRFRLDAGWNEFRLSVPAAHLNPGVTRLAVEGRYSSYRWVAFQAP